LGVWICGTLPGGEGEDRGAVGVSGGSVVSTPQALTPQPPKGGAGIVFQPWSSYPYRGKMCITAGATRGRYRTSL
ncbi:MAG: hypothetical protein LUH10_15295, partial [Tannerellaceae bacterium]|nr:hypothetical protein [Tannerellaceae bacterium]